MPPASLIAHAEAIGADLWLLGRDFNYSGDKQQWNYGGRSQRRNSLAYPSLRGANQLLNASAALAALEVLRLELPVGAQEVRTGLVMVELPGRFQVLPGRPTVILDVAHNPHAAAALGQNLGNMGFHRYTYAVFGIMEDKDIDGVIAPMAAIRRPLVRGRPAVAALGRRRQAGRKAGRAAAGGRERGRIFGHRLRRSGPGVCKCDEPGRGE